MPVRISKQPYPHRGRWRFHVIEAPGVYSWAPSGRDEAEARDNAEIYAKGLQARVDLTVGGVLARYLDWLRAMDRKALTLTSARNHLVKILEPLLGVEAARITTQRARARYMELAAEAAAATHQIALGRARSMWKWALRQGLVKSNPWVDVDKIGRMKKGKPQLRIDEARKLAAVCMEAVLRCDGALSILIAQMMALRLSEIIFREVRDADDDCRLLWVPDAKTPAGKRALEIPEVLRPAVRLRVQGRAANAPLIRKTDGERPSRRWAQHQIAKYCELAGVPSICMHSLRGQWATIAVESGALTHAVAAALGHASFEVTAAHYAKPEAVEAAKQKRRLGVLAGGKK
jgi:integrase